MPLAPLIFVNDGHGVHGFVYGSDTESKGTGFLLGFERERGSVDCLIARVRRDTIHILGRLRARSE